MDGLIGILGWAFLGAVPLLIVLLWQQRRFFDARIAAGTEAESRIEVFERELQRLGKELGDVRAELRASERMLATTTENEKSLVEMLRTAERHRDLLATEMTAIRSQNTHLMTMLAETYAHERLVLERVVAPAPVESNPTIAPDKWIEELEKGGLWKDPREVVQEEAARDDALRQHGDGSAPHA